MRGPRRFVQKPTDTKNALKNLLNLLKDYKFKLAITIICAILSTAFTVLGPILIGKATTCIFEGINLYLNHTGSIDFKLLVWLLGIAIVLYIISAIFSYLQSWFLVEISTEISYKLRKKLIKKVTSMPMSEIDNKKRGDILSRIVNDVDSIQMGITQTFLQFITAIITIIGVFIMMMSINIWMSLANLILIPTSFGLIILVTRKSQKYFKKRLNYKGELNAQIEEVFTAHDVVSAYNGQEIAILEFNKSNEKWYVNEWKSQFYSSLTEPIMNFISNLSYVLIAVLGAIFVLQKAIAVGDILAFFQYVKNFTQPIQQITKIMDMLQTAMAASERIFEFLEHDDEIESGSLEINDLKESIEFDNVHFGYGSEEIIKGITFEVKKGEKVAIIGPTGAGKSTIVKLLMRFYDVNSGKIKIDDRDIREFKKDDLRSLIGMILQDTWLFSDTIKENIRYGSLDATSDEIINVSKQVNVDDFALQLPKAYNTILNEDTDNISHGQKQLITIARTLLANKKILILDEATSSVDTRTEKLIQKAMDKLTEEKTSIVIAHRLSTIKNADKIIVIDDGRIIEAGTHEELLNKKGYYYNTLNSEI
ncbi:putative ABC transporter ATP-binding protein [Methanobrevibacter oralis]|uniref:ABC transporter ATP-binding protein n=1 Tax=Methanobrevibacter oralis TaxID=66851 RepID=A0A166BBJ9_METOA|nr:putative ABC transporter ATP-binding protein [Methanobrevibacter oralis]